MLPYLKFNVAYDEIIHVESPFERLCQFLGVVSCLAASSIGLSAGFLLLRTGGVGPCYVGGRCSMRFGLLSRRICPS